MAQEQKKIGVDPETKQLVGLIAEAEDRSEARQVKHWAKKDAKRLGLSTKTVPSPEKLKQPGLKDNPKINLNKVKPNGNAR